MDRYAVIGNPVSHSRSPALHREFARQTGQAICYDFLEADAFLPAIDQFRKDGGKGLSVTLPFKADAFAYADECTVRAQRVGVASVLKFESGRCLADCMDGLGLIIDLTQNLDCVLKHKRILLLGAGGAARGCVLDLLDQQPAQLVIANRNSSKAISVAREFGAEALGYDALGDEAFDVVINATSAGHFGQLLPVPLSVFAAGSLFYDLTYGEKAQGFLTWAGQAATQVSDGFGMLKAQAREQFRWWRGL